MGDINRLVSGSRAAPRDPSNRSGRQPVSIFHDTRSYRMWDGHEDDDAPVSRRRGRGTGALESKDTNYRINEMHRTFRASQRGPRSSARAMVDEIVSGGSVGDDERKFYDSLEQDLDPEQLARLRERNKKRLDTLEKQLQKLQARKDAVMQGGEDPEDEADDESAAAAAGERTRTYKADEYKDDTSASDSSPVKRPAPARKPGAPKSAWSDQYGESAHATEGAGGAGPAAAPAQRPKVQTRIPKPLAGSRPSSAKPPTAPATAHSEGEDAKGYQSDPGRAGATRPVTSTLSASGRGIGYKSAKEARRSCTVPEPFTFDRRELFKKKSIASLRLEQEMLERLEMEQIEYTTTFKARPPPKSTTDPLYQMGIAEKKERSERNRRESKERLRESQQPFEFWVKAREEEKARMRNQLSEIDRVKKELSLYGVKDSRVKRIEQGAWDAVKTDFTSVEQEELRILEMMEASKRKFTPHQEARKKELLAERNKKLQSTLYTDELERRLKEELEKQEKRFRSVPVPKHIKENVWGTLELEQSQRATKAQERALRLLSKADLPPRMKRHQAEHPEEWAPKHKKYPGSDGDTITGQHTFKPKVKGTIPDFQQMHEVLKLQLATRKQEMQREANRTDIKPFYLRTEWVPAEELRRYKKVYVKSKPSSHLPPGKLKKLGLDANASQWDVIDKLTSKNQLGMDRAGLTQAEMLEYGITSPSYHAINEAIEGDIQVLRDNRWPHMKGGRVKTQPTPIPESMKKRPDKEPSLTVAARARQLAVQKEVREREKARKKAEEDALAERKKRRETWGMKDKVMQKLAKDEEDRRQSAEKAKEELHENIKDFRNKDKEWQARVAATVEKVKGNGLLMETIKRRLKKQANEQFRKHLKAQGLEDLADQIEQPH